MTETTAAETPATVSPAMTPVAPEANGHAAPAKKPAPRPGSTKKAVPAAKPKPAAPKAKAVAKKPAPAPGTAKKASAKKPGKPAAPNTKKADIKKVEKPAAPKDKALTNRQVAALKAIHRSADGHLNRQEIGKKLGMRAGFRALLGHNHLTEKTYPTSLVGMGLLKVVVVEDEPNAYALTAAGRKAIEAVLNK